MQITFDLDEIALQCIRTLRVIEGTEKYSIPNEAQYDPVRTFLDRFRPTGYPFQMINLLHAAGVKMLGKRGQENENALLAAGGLYLSLDHQHQDLGFSPLFGDFSSGFCHQFGVALAIMSMSEAYNIAWDQLTAIPKDNFKTLDYRAPIPNTSHWLYLEAKGVSSEANRNNARRSARLKKCDHTNGQTKSVNAPKHQFPEPTAMIGVITVAARPEGKGVLEIIDPDFIESEEQRRPENQKAGRYLHYVGVARFAGLEEVAKELHRRASS